jgi:hypothetical protein
MYSRFKFVLAEGQKTHPRIPFALCVGLALSALSPQPSALMAMASARSAPRINDFSTGSPRATQYGVLSGTVINGDGSPAVDSVVVVVERLAGGTPANQRFVRIARGDRAGRFWIRTLWPSADYRALAFSRLDRGEEFNPSVQERILSQGQPLSILEGQTATIGLLLFGP